MLLSAAPCCQHTSVLSGALSGFGSFTSLLQVSQNVFTAQPSRPDNMQGANLRAGSAHQVQRLLPQRRTHPPVAAKRLQRSKLVCCASTAPEQFPAKVCIVLGTQWGDEGKGKLVDILAQQYDVIARAQVGNLTAGCVLGLLQKPASLLRKYHLFSAAAY